MFGSIVRISDNKNIDTFMLENGYAFVKESVQGMMFYDKLQTLYKKAKDTKKGIFNDKSTNIQFYEDFTVAPNKKLKLQKN
jgi:endonuclease YncB( thermonuclease family)